MTTQYFTFPLKSLKDRTIEPNQISVPVRKGAKNKSMTESLAAVIPAFSATDINTLSNTLSILTKVCNEALVEIVSDSIRSGKTSGITPTLNDVVEYLLADKIGSARFSKESISTWFDTYGAHVIQVTALMKLFGARKDISEYSEDEYKKVIPISDSFRNLFCKLSARKDKDSVYSDAEYKQLKGAFTSIKEATEEPDEMFEVLETKILVEFKPAIERIDALF